MFERVKEVRANKNRVARAQKARRKDDLDKLRQEASFRAQVMEQIRTVDALLESPQIKSVSIVVPEKHLPLFSRIIYASDLAEYDIRQSQEVGRANEFEVSRKIVGF